MAGILKLDGGWWHSVGTMRPSISACASMRCCLATLLIMLASSQVGAVDQPTLSPVQPAPVATGITTLVCLRHGERLPDAQAQGHDLGQLSPRGLKRALALPELLLGRYGRPDFIFAPDPAKTIGSKDGTRFCYVRPLATIEPTAIACGLPVNTLLGYKEIHELEAELRKPPYHGRMVYVCWEHAMLERFVRQVVTDGGGDGAQVPVWPASDFDSIYLVRMNEVDGRLQTAFVLDHERLDDLK